MWQGEGPDCGPDSCSPVGACCAYEGTCVLTTEAGCNTPDVFLGVGNDCDPNPCPQPPGACCAPVGTCSIKTEPTCHSPSMWQGIDTTCEPNPCIPIGACCVHAGTCTVTTEAACSADWTTLL